MEKLSQPKKIGGWIAVVAALVSMGLHLYLVQEYYTIKLGLSEGAKSICNLSSKFNCDVVAASPYSSLFSVPMAFWGLWTNLILILLLVGSLLNLTSNRGRWARVSLLIGTFIFATSLVMAYISSARLGTYCLFCMGAYAASIFIFAGTIHWAKSFPGSFAEDLRSVFVESKSLLLFFVAIPALAFLSHSIMMDNYGAGKMESRIQASINEWSSNPVQTFDLTKGISSQIGENPAITVVEFIDLFCPHCRAASPSMHAFADGRADVRLVVKIFPLDGTCNPDTRMHSGDGLRCQWSYALMCIDQIAKKGNSALDWIFENQELLHGDSFDHQIEELSKVVQVPVDEIKSCMGKPETKSVVTAMAAEGIQSLIQGTPSVFVNGKKLEHGQFIPVLDGLYRHLH